MARPRWPTWTASASVIAALGRWNLAFDDSGGISIGAVQQEYRARFRVAVALKSDNHAVTNPGLRAQRFLQIFRINIHASWSDNDVFSTALEIEKAGFILLRDVASPEPPICFGDGQGLAVLTV